ncbi:peptidyl-prolyl cis-trans isomerase FKBP8-like isoform X3 [Dreissena polymorpha]|uniref:peptidylprolyl isomerase n=1 Tax=Dreissena polymorpha TaxID=45954 RepID=A0A9D4H904_DREPO|nr:peptidyl-prolyl cis-trans isomerase FKBP8-like isoform X3 [Dreissena polymorpha]KAH3829725.1 hypothetical protein DPMN_102953 [Dreissena polymorpha]
MADTGQREPFSKSEVSEETTPTDHSNAETEMPVTEDTPIMEGAAMPPKADTPPLMNTKADGDVQDHDASKPELPADNDMEAEGGATDSVEKELADNDLKAVGGADDSAENEPADNDLQAAVGADDSAENKPADNDLQAEGVAEDIDENEIITDPTTQNSDYTDILGNGTLLKKVIHKGTGPRAQMREKVTVTLLSSIPVMGITLPEQRLTFVVGEADVVPALDMAVTLMEVGEVAEIVSGFDYMYGEIGLPPDIPPKANFKLEVTLHSSVPFDYGTLDFDQKFEEAKKKKERGNYFFKRQEFELGIRLYTQALKIIDPSATKLCEVSADQLQQVLEFRSVVHCNVSASLFKLSVFEGARQSAQESVQIQPSHAKAYIRLGQAEEKLGNPEEAIKAYKKALSFDATNRWLHNECARLSKVSQKTKENQQKMYSKMFWGSNPPPVNELQKETPEPSSVSSFWKKGGLGLVGAGLVSLVGIGMYRYLNH